MDRTREAYRVRFEAKGQPVAGLVPEALVAEMLGLDRRPGHEEVYRWLAKHQSAVEAALLAKQEGRGPAKAPFDRLMIAEER